MPGEPQPPRFLIVFHPALFGDSQASVKIPPMAPAPNLTIE
jgi:hypothetical protein